MDTSRTLKEIEIALIAVDAKIEDMNETLSGCDWCCGGGDERMAELQQERAALMARREGLLAHTSP